MTEPTYATCPCGCGQRQDLGLLAASCTARLERELGDVASLVRELDVTLSRQARISVGGKSGKGWAHEKLPIHEGARQAGDVLANTLTTWARDVSGDPQSLGLAPGRPPAVQAAWILLGSINEIRRHPEVKELVDEITSGIAQARHAVDRPADLAYVGPCRAVNTDEYGRAHECGADLYARPEAAEVVCRVCGGETVVAEQRAWLLNEADDRLFTVREAAQMIGDFYGTKVTEAGIRGLIHRKKLGYRSGKLLRLGDLREVLGDIRAQRAVEAERIGA